LKAAAPASSEITDLIVAAEMEHDALARERDEARQTSVDPTATSAAVDQARLSDLDLTFRLERREAALAALRVRHDEAKAREENERLQAHRAEVIARRDEAVSALRRYESHARKIGAILQAVHASNAEVEAANRVGGGPWIQPAEAAARGMAANDIHWLVSGVRLPPFEPNAHGRMLWLPPPPVIPLLPQHVVEASAALGHEGRRIGEEVERQRAENGANPGRKRLPM
jgi:hypothetical protein